MTQVRAGEAGARRARAILVQRSRIAREAGVVEVEPAVPGVRAAGPAEPRRQDAVEEVDPALNHLEDPARVADAHEVTRPGGREERRRPADGLEGLLARLPHAEAAERIAVEAECCDLLDRAASKLPIRSALCDAEQELAGRARLVALPQC